LRSRLTKLHIFLKQIPKNIKINAFSICATHLWFANIDIQFILDPYVAATYYTSYMKKIENYILSLKKCITNNIDVNKIIPKLRNVFLNAQQMVTQLVIYLVFSLPLYHSSQTF
jgi:hypothetical protein